MSYRRKEEHRRKLRRSFGKTEIDEKAWLVNKSHKNVKVKGKKRPSKSQEPSSQKLAKLMKITRRTVRHIQLDYKRNFDVMKKELLNT